MEGQITAERKEFHVAFFPWRLLSLFLFAAAVGMLKMFWEMFTASPDVWPVPGCGVVYLIVWSLLALITPIQAFTTRLLISPDGLKYTGLGWTLEAEWKDAKIVGPYWNMKECILLEKYTVRASRLIEWALPHPFAGMTVPLSFYPGIGYWNNRHVLDDILDIARRTEP